MKMSPKGKWGLSVPQLLQSQLHLVNKIPPGFSVHRLGVVRNRSRAATHQLLDPEIKPLTLTGEEKRNLIAFLRSLTGSIPVR